MVGEIRLYAGTVPPKRWLFCDGQWVSQNKYSELYKVVGNRFGYRWRDTDQYYYDYSSSFNPEDPNTWYEYDSDTGDYKVPEYRPGMFKLPDLKSPIIDIWGRLKPEIRPGKRIEVPGYNGTFPNWTPRERIVSHLRRETGVKYIIRYEDDPIDTRQHRRFFNMMYDLRRRNRHTD